MKRSVEVIASARGDAQPCTDSGRVIVKAFKGQSERFGPGTHAVDLAEVKRFGRCQRYGDNRTWCMGQLVDGEIVHVMHKYQSPDILRVIRKRLKGVPGPITTRESQEAFTWEAA